MTRKISSPTSLMNDYFFCLRFVLNSFDFRLVSSSRQAFVHDHDRMQTNTQTRNCAILACVPDAFESLVDAVGRTFSVSCNRRGNNFFKCAFHLLISLSQAIFENIRDHNRPAFPIPAMVWRL